MGPWAGGELGRVGKGRAEPCTGWFLFFNYGNTTSEGKAYYD